MGERETNLWVVDTKAREQEIEHHIGPRVWPVPLGWLSLLGLLIIASVTVWLGVAYGHGKPGPATTSGGQQQVTHMPKGNLSGGMTNPSSTSTSSSASGAASDIQVDVHGDVRHPGVVAVPSNARVQDAIRAAGGFAHAADAMGVNQAAMIWDGEEIDVPSAVTAATGTSVVTGHSSSVSKLANMSGSQGRIDINTADLTTLETLPGVGPKRAAEMIQYRVSHGPFRSVSDLSHIRGIGPKSLAKWAGMLFVGGTGASQDLSEAGTQPASKTLS